MIKMRNRMESMITKMYELQAEINRMVYLKEEETEPENWPHGEKDSIYTEEESE
jgi:hypothetical protein